MAEEKRTRSEKQMMMCQNCAGGMCGPSSACCECHSGRHSIFRWVLGLVIILIVFSLGFKLGELNILVGGRSGYGMMQGGYPDSRFFMMSPGGMYWNQSIDAPRMMRTTTQNATGSSSSTKNP